jgi:hypothetical protein
MGFLSGLFGGGAYKSAINDLQKDKSQELSYWNSRAHADFLNDSQNQAALKQAREMLREGTERAENRAAVSGATEESVAQQKAANSQAMGNVVSNIAANATQQKDQAMLNYLEANRQYTASINNMKIQKDQQKAAAVGGLINSGISLATSGGLL